MAANEKHSSLLGQDRAVRQASTNISVNSGSHLATETWRWR